MAPRKFSAEDVYEARRIATFFLWFGGIILGAAFVCLTTGVQGPKRAGDPPQTIISVSEFSKTDMTGKLNEVRLSGKLHLDKISHVRFPTGTVIDMSQSLIPFTDEKWTEGDPVQVFVNSGWMTPVMDAEAWARAFEREGLPAGRAGVINVQKLMAEKTSYGFTGNIVTLFRDNGLIVTDDVVMLEIIEGKREKILKKMYSGYMALFKVFGGIGGIFFIIGLGAKASLSRVESSF